MMKQEKYIEKFRSDFALLYGTYPTVKVEVKNRLPKFSHHDLDTIETVLNHFLPKKGDTIGSKSRKREFVYTRMVYCMLTYDLGYTYNEIGNKIGGRDHSTVIYNLKTGYDLLETDKVFQDLYIKLSSKINPELYPHARITEITPETSDYRGPTYTSAVHTRKFNVTRPGVRTRIQSKKSSKQRLSI